MVTTLGQWQAGKRLQRAILHGKADQKMPVLTVGGCAPQAQGRSATG